MVFRDMTRFLVHRTPIHEHIRNKVQQSNRATNTWVMWKTAKRKEIGILEAEACHESYSQAVADIVRRNKVSNTSRVIQCRKRM